MTFFTHNGLPTLLTSFVGRTEEIAAITGQLADPQCRLLTLAGPGGSGKTRLAIETALHLVDTYPDGVFFVDLSPLRTTDDLVTSIAGVVGCELYGGTAPEQQLLHYLSRAAALLVLDNFEHLLAGVELVQHILEAATGIKILVTSREVLNLSGEWVYTIPGLSFPLDTQAGELSAYSAVQLFIERAQQVSALFTIEDDHACIAHICALVEGIPLAIELAASWLRVLPCNEIVEEIQRGLDILETSARDVVVRHRSMRAVLQHSWDLLTTQEQAVFAALSVFRGGFTREAAQEVTGASLSLLASLVDKSLVRRNEQGRFTLHELVRQFAREKLEAAGEIEVVLDKHCEFFIRYLHEREETIHLTGRAEVLAEMDNIRAAYGYAAQEHKLAALQQAMPPLSWIYLLQAWFDEGERMFELAEDALRDMPPTDETRFLLGMTLMYKASCQRDKPEKTQQMKQNVETGLELWQGLAPRREMILPLWNATFVFLHLRSDPEQVIDTANQQLYCASQCGDPFGELQALGFLSHIYWQGVGDFEMAQQYIEAALEISRQPGFDENVISQMLPLGPIAYAQGRYAEAHAHFDVFQFEPGTVPRHHLHSEFLILGQVLLDMGEDETAKTAFEACVAAANDLRTPQMHAAGLAGLGAVAVFQNDIDTAEAHYAESRARSQSLSRGTLRFFDELELESLGFLALVLGHYDEALEHYGLVLSHYREANYRLQLTACCSRVGHALLGQGDEQRAREYLLNALQVAAAIGAFPVLVEALVGVAQLPAVPLEDAVRMLTLGLQHPTANRYTRSRAQQLLTTMQAEMHRSAFRVATERGKMSSLDEVVAFVDRLFPRHDTAQAQANRDLIEPLTAREQDVLRLLAERRTNSEIADVLFISVGTVKTHVHNICSKLNASNRRHAARRAQELQLI